MNTFSVYLNSDGVKDEEVFKRKLVNDQNRIVTIGEWKIERKMVITLLKRTVNGDRLLEKFWIL